MPKRKRQNVKVAAEAAENEDTQHSVLGGLKDPTGNSRVSGDGDVEDDATQYKIPFNHKYIVCESRGDEKNATLIFTHGAGGGIANPATKDFAKGFASQSPVLCYQGTMNLQSRVKTFHAVIDHVKLPKVTLGGRSMGARAAVLASKERKEDINALILVSYPLSSGGKNSNSKDQTAQREGILLDIPPSTDVLFVIGSKDSQCDLEHLAKLRATMTARSWLIEVEDADHGMSIKSKHGVQLLRQMTGSMAANWVKHRDPEKQHCTVRWDADEAKAIHSGWSFQSQEPKSKRRKTK